MIAPVFFLIAKEAKEGLHGAPVDFAFRVFPPVVPNVQASPKNTDRTVHAGAVEQFGRKFGDPFRGDVIPGSCKQSAYRRIIKPFVLARSKQFDDVIDRFMVFGINPVDLGV